MNQPETRSVLFIESNHESEKSKTSSNINRAISSYTLNTDSYEDSTISRPVRHDYKNQCFCYANREDCTTCSSQYTDDSDIFMLTSSESRSEAGSSSSSDGSSLEPRCLDIEENSEFSLISEDVSCSEMSKPPDLQELIEALETKKVEFREEFLKNSTILGQMMTLYGFQRAVLNDRLIDLDRLISEHKKKLTNSKNFSQNPEDVAQILLEKCHVEHSDARKCYLKRLIDEDIMKSNMARIEEITGILNRLKVTTSSESSEDLDMILDDVSTCQSFCPDDV